MRIDAHQHYWKIDRGDYGWIDPDDSLLYCDYLEKDLLPHLKRHKIDRTIAVQAAATIEETKYLLKLSEQSESIAGVVGWVDLEKEDYKEQIAQFRNHSKFLGIRVMIQEMKDSSVITKSLYMNRWVYLAEQDIPVDLLVKASQLPDLVPVIERVPLRGVIDHIAKPNIASGAISSWREQMEQIASQPTIYCKLSGMVTEADHQRWKKEDLEPYINHVFRVFGADRLIYGSDWPACLLAASYGDVYDTLLTTLSAQASKKDLKQIFGLNAATFYKLEQKMEGLR